MQRPREDDTCAMPSGRCCTEQSLATPARAAPPALARRAAILAASVAERDASSSFTSTPRPDDGRPSETCGAGGHWASRLN